MGTRELTGIIAELYSNKDPEEKTLDDPEKTPKSQIIKELENILKLITDKQTQTRLTQFLKVQKSSSSTYFEFTNLLKILENNQKSLKIVIDNIAAVRKFYEDMQATTNRRQNSHFRQDFKIE